jgi:hypothetical protein
VKILVICPTHNSDSTIQKIIESFDDSFWNKIDQFYFIDNASIDNTLGIIEGNKIKFNKIEVKRNIENIGYGGSMKIGMKYFLDSEYDYLLLLHSDDQTDWNRISHELISNAENLDFKITSRFDVKSNIEGYSKIRVFGNLFFNWLSRKTTGLNIKDPGAAIGIYSKKVIKSINFNQITNGYMFHPQINIIIFNEFRNHRVIPMNWKDATVKKRFPYIRYGLNLTMYLIFYGAKRHVKK